MARQRTRTGCMTCRHDGYKCDETRPVCQRCVRLGKECPGYGVQLRWREVKTSKKAGVGAGAGTFSTWATSSTSRSSSSRSARSLSSSSSPPSHVVWRAGCSPERNTLDHMQYMVPGGLSPLDRRLLHHWLTGLAGVVSMADGPSGNPYLTHLTPLLVASPALRSATLSMSAWHLSLLGGGGNKVGEHLGGNRDAAAMDVAGRHHRLEAISSLRQSMLQPGAAAAEISLATILMLQLADRLFAGADDSPANHLAGASAVVRTRPVGRWAATPTGSFLLGVYLYQDVLASVTRGTRPLFDLDQDSVMVEGLGSLARLTAVVRVVGHISSMHCMDFDTSRVYAAHLKTMLDSLEPQPPIDDGTEDGAALTAEAYRQAAYIYLGRVAYNVESPDRVGVCLALLGRVPATSSVVSAHVWPIWTAGCEAVDARNRQLVRDRLDEMHRLRRLPSLHRLRCDVEDIWRVKDAQRASTGKDGVDCIKAIWKRRQRTADLI